VVLPFESIVWFDTVIDAVNPMTPGLRPAREPFVEVPFDECMSLAVLLFKTCRLSAPIPDVKPSMEMAFGLVILDSEEANLNGRVSK
jgi:hypothetical protein